jgi:hypothetical protein
MKLPPHRFPMRVLQPCSNTIWSSDFLNDVRELAWHWATYWDQPCKRCAISSCLNEKLINSSACTLLLSTVISLVCLAMLRKLIECQDGHERSYFQLLTQKFPGQKKTFSSVDDSWSEIQNKHRPPDNEACALPTMPWHSAILSTACMVLILTSPSSPLHPISKRSILILSNYLRLGLPSGLFPSGFPTNNLYAFLFAPFGLHAPPISSSSTSLF